MFSFVALAARHKFAELTEDEAMRESGRLAVRRAVLQAAKLLGVKRAMKPSAR